MQRDGGAWPHGTKPHLRLLIIEGNVRCVSAYSRGHPSAQSHSLYNGRFWAVEYKMEKG